MAHPALLLRGQPGEQPAAVAGERELGAAELARLGALDPAAELVRPSPACRNRCRAPGCRARAAPCAAPARPRRRPTPGPPESTSARGARSRIRSSGGVVRQQLGEDAALADPPRDQLRVLAAEVEDEDLLVRGLGGATSTASTAGAGSDAGTRRLAGPSRARLVRASASASGRLSRSVIATATPSATAARPFEPMPTDCSRCSCLPSVCSAGATITSARWNSGMSS